MSPLNLIQQHAHVSIINSFINNLIFITAAYFFMITVILFRCQRLCVNCSCRQELSAAESAGLTCLGSR